MNKRMLSSLDGRTKFIAWLALTIVMFLFDSYLQYLSLILILALIFYGFYDVTERKTIYKSWKFLFLVPTINLIANLLFENGEVLYAFSVFTFTDTDIQIFMRIFLLIFFSRCVLLKTDAKELGIAIGKIVHSLSFHRINSTAIPLLIIVILSFIEKFRQLMQEINKAYLLRTNGISQKGIVQKVRSRAMLLSPLLMISMKKTEQVSTALLAKGYHRGSQVVDYSKIKYSENDYIAYGILILFIFLVMKI